MEPELDAGVAGPSGALVAFEGVDALGLCRLTRRSPTLAGGVPVRVAQACVPLLEGNALGLQVTLTRPLRLARRWGRFSLQPGPGSEQLCRAHAAAVAALVAQGYLPRGGAFHRMLARGPLVHDGGRLRLWTGLLVRPRPGFWVWAAGAANRRNVLFDLGEVVVPDSEHLVPLVLELRPKPGVRSLLVDGEIATLLPVWPRVAFSRRTLAEAEDVGRAHLDFYDPAYFEAKKAGLVTRKYRQRFASAGGAEPPLPAPGEEARCQVIDVGPVDLAVEALAPALLPEGLADRVPARYGRCERVLFRNTIPFTVHHDGLSVDVQYDREALERAARDVEARFQRVFGSGTVEEHRGALWYLTRYFTPHPAGEPHFFVKPWAFTRTPPGFSCVIEGVHGPAYDILRGVVRTDRFFATPAVFHLWRPGERVEVEAGRPLISALPVPRALMEADMALLRPEGLPRLG
jgi:hypothetical protein